MKWKHVTIKDNLNFERGVFLSVGRNTSEQYLEPMFAFTLSKPYNV